MKKRTFLQTLFGTVLFHPRLAIIIMGVNSDAALSAPLILPHRASVVKCSCLLFVIVDHEYWTLGRRSK